MRPAGWLSFRLTVRFVEEKREGRAGIVWSLSKHEGCCMLLSAVDPHMASR
jgi:hypothetical protein